MNDKMLVCEHRADELTGTHRAVYDQMLVLTEKWRKQGYVPHCAPHHFLPPQAECGLSTDRQARRVLNDLVDMGLVLTERTRRYKVWLLPRGVGYQLDWWKYVDFD
jgi:hypothetical protein